MPVRADEPLRRTTLNLGAADVEAMIDLYGTGWTTVVRRLVYEHINQRNPMAPARRTLGDLTDET